LIAADREMRTRNPPIVALKLGQCVVSR